MAIYRFRVTFEDYDEVIREIDVKSNQTFADLHQAIHKSTGYNPDYSSSFYVSNDQWTKGEEIAYKPSQRKIDRGVALMENAKLSSFIDDPHQKFYYTFNFDRPFDFHVELVKILADAPGTEYPVVVRSVGEAPKQFGNAFNPTVLPPTSEEFDFLNEMEYTPEDTSDFSEVKDDMDEGEEHGQEDEQEEEDEFGDEFSDNENFGDDEFGGGRRGNHDDY
ncbi:plasmid pRiA4b ORF-3 family protein [Mucilaginibacter sp. RS28]|uniref:Plasmid pRiA4b ORF-3 family protein n=1 Tax=Mucilaginibacter straminoryzae TaxID=2932774 RepID=A0A9X1X427_9SPHI|nr:plasmid pRiA4b ORF-3 family protein [Mucilaginibacter straminoryzae]MCJ8210216.1 plasmid pRiA4b ORF-3 family protein [Mucilaginibacter straminoryzae]